MSAKIANVNGLRTRYYLSTKIDTGAVAWVQVDALPASEYQAAKSSVVKFEEWWIYQNSTNYWNAAGLTAGSTIWPDGITGAPILIPTGTTVSAGVMAVGGTAGSQPFMPTSFSVRGDTASGQSGTIAMRVRFDSGTSNRVWSNEQAGNVNLQLQMSGASAIQFLVKDPVGSTLLSTSAAAAPSLPAGVWHVIAAGFNATGISLWGDGGLKKTAATAALGNVTSTRSGRFAASPLSAAAGPAYSYSHFAYIPKLITDAEFTYITGAWL
jgi:hypothetical protein